MFEKCVTNIGPLGENVPQELDRYNTTWISRSCEVYVIAMHLSYDDHVNATWNFREICQKNWTVITQLDRWWSREGYVMVIYLPCYGLVIVIQEMCHKNRTIMTQLAWHVMILLRVWQPCTYHVVTMSVLFETLDKCVTRTQLVMWWSVKGIW